MGLKSRHINQYDDLRDVFLLIYSSDPFIYRDLFSDIETGYQIFLRVCNNPMSLFFKDNYRLAVDEDTEEILGICSCYKPGVKWNPALFEQAYILSGIKVPESFDSVSKYFNKTYNYNTHQAVACNICVKEGHRGQHIGDFLLKELLEEIGDNTDIYLTVLADNIAAIKLYQNNGFVIMDDEPFLDYGGHNAPEVPCYLMWRYSK